MVRHEHQTRARLTRGAEHLCRLGPRALGEFFSEFALRTDSIEVLLRQIDIYQRLTPELLRSVGGDRFPRRGPIAVPHALGALR